MNLALRWMKFNAVGGLGIGVQLGALAVLKSLFGVNYLWATGWAVEMAVLHNFFWHMHWTWGDRKAGWRVALLRLVRFNLTTGALSIFSNLVLMRWLVGQWKLHYLWANLIAIAATSIANFLMSEWFVFRRRDS
ncbi:MAG: GtrA family protein [Acidobacteriia bacterium]|nr:GtrA family protein [Terriglobia bacterium]